MCIRDRLNSTPKIIPLWRRWQAVAAIALLVVISTVTVWFWHSPSAEYVERKSVEIASLSPSADMNEIIPTHPSVCLLYTSSLAGSIATMDVLVRTMVKAGIPLGDAINMVSETPARIMGVDDRKGTLQKDKDADLLVLDRDLNIRAAWAMGNLIEGTNTLF